MQQTKNQSGNVFFAIFGAVALVGVLTAGVATFVKGPLATSVKITRQNTAENQMSIAGQVAVMAAASAPGGGDCDSDAFVEPIEWREDLTKPFPAGGGLIPSTIGISKKDPWGTEYGYCVWDHGPSHNGAGSCGGSTQKRLEGTNSKAYPVVALVSAGPDKTFTTTCRTFDAADVDNDDALDTAGVDLALVSKASLNDDDIIFTYSYEEATGASGGLWSLKSGDPNTAIIDKKIESTGVGSFQGGVLLPDSSLIACDPTTAGIMAKNASGNGIQICDGSAWVEISGGGGIAIVSTTPDLFVNPQQNNAMTVDGTCGQPTCYGSGVTFLVGNQGEQTSAVIVASLSNTTYFEIQSNTCAGIALARGESCQVVVRPKANGNTSYTGTLNITANNNPFAVMQGSSTGFGCSPGRVGPGGYYVGCGVSGYDIIVTPGGCTGTTTNPTCAGGADTVALAWGTAFPENAYCCNNGPQDTVDLVARSGGGISYPAAQWCYNLIYGGYSDWYLPGPTEFHTFITPNRAAIGGFNGANWHWTSTSDHSGYQWAIIVDDTGGQGAPNIGSTYRVRCARREPFTMPSPTVDTTPANVTFATSTGATAAQTRTSNTITITGITSSINVSVSGPGSPQISKNGGAYASSFTAANGDTVTVRATSPAAGVQNTVTVTMGTGTATWKVSTSQNITIRAFTTQAIVSPAMGGLGGADSLCTSRANTAGLGSNWIAVLNTVWASNTVGDRLPWNWTELRNTNGQLVATSLADFMDGTIAAPLNYTETGAIAASSLVWTGMRTDGTGDQSIGDCSGWTNSGANGQTGDTAITTGGQYFRSTSWSGCYTGTIRLLCMEAVGVLGADGDPDPVLVVPAIAYTSGGTATSNTVTVTGIVGSIMVTITPSGGTANIIKNGASVGATSVLVNNNDTIAFTQTVPASAGSKNTATLTFGPDSYTWWVGYANNANIGMMFVTSDSYRGDSMGGLSGADTKCQTAATNAGLNGTYKALLSASTVNAIDRIPFNFGAVKNVNQGVIAANWSNFWSGSLLITPNITEFGVARSSLVNSASSSIGYKEGNPGNNYCADWTGYGTIIMGNTAATNTTWIANNTDYCTYNRALYCIAALTPAENNKPAALDIKPKVVTTASGRGISDAYTISGISAPIAASISGSGSPRIKVNGGSEVSSTSLNNGDSVEFLMDAPGSAGNKNTATITLGGSTYTWWVGYANSANVGRIFVTSVSYDGALGGLVGADAKCNLLATAAGYPSGWVAVLSTSTVNARDRIPFNWGKLRRLDNTIVANDWEQLWYGSLAAQPNISETLVARNIGVNTGTTSTGIYKADGACYSDWTSNGGSLNQWRGQSNTTSGGWIANTMDYCAYGVALYCMKVD